MTRQNEVQGQAHPDIFPAVFHRFKARAAQHGVQVFTSESQPAVTVNGAHVFLLMAVKVRDQQQPVRTHHTGDLAQGVLRTGKMVENKINAGKVRFTVTQGKMIQFTDTQGNPGGILAETATGQLQHAGGNRPRR